MKKTLLLCILDGCGLRDEKEGNAFKNAIKPTYDYLLKNYPHTSLDASSQAVGLPIGQMGNSEVGHMNIGAGRVVYQPQELINQSIEDKSFYENKEILNVINHVKENNSKLHLMGLISDGGVHSHISHLMALLNLCKQKNVEKVYLHLFTDGRDTDSKSAYKYIYQVEKKLKELSFGAIATIGGRYYGMDRDNNYDRLKKAYDASVKNIGNYGTTIKEDIEKSYEQGITDEFLVPTIYDENGKIEKNDGLIAFNYRKDRLREILTCLTNEENGLDEKLIPNLKVVTMMPVVESVKAPHAFNDAKLKNILGEYLEKNGLSQLRIAETEKFAHVTFFFDGGKEVDYEHEKKILIPSKKVATYDLLPKMSAEEITNNLLKELDKDYLDVVILNYANGDMLGHTGNYNKAIEAIEFLDKCLEKIYNKIKSINGTMIITSDHGNCDIMLNDDKSICKTHTTNKVPFIITNKNVKLQETGKLADIAPTILTLLNLPIPEDMQGKSLIK